MRARARAALAATALAALALGACETTQQESARIGRGLGHQSARAGTTGIGSANRNVRVARAALVSGSPAAVAVELENTGAQAQAAIPVGIVVRDAKGAPVYRNDTAGIETSLLELALLPAHGTAWWVDNEVLASGGTPATVAAAVGAARTTAPAAPPRVTASGVSASNAFPGPHVDATLRDAGGPAQSQLPVYAVALSGGRVVGAGRAIVASLPAGASASVEIPMTGTVASATISITVDAA